MNDRARRIFPADTRVVSRPTIQGTRFGAEVRNWELLEQGLQDFLYEPQTEVGANDIYLTE